MSTNIKLKRSSVEGKIPTTTDLDFGELAINTFDGKLYLKKNDGADAIDSAVMDSELTDEAAVKALDQGVSTTDSPTFDGITNTGDQILENHTIVSKTQTTTAVTQVALDSFSATTFAGGEVLVTAIQGSSRHVIKLLVINDGTDTHDTQYAEIITGSSLFTLTTDINGGNLRVLCTPASTTSTKFNTYVTRIEN